MSKLRKKVEEWCEASAAYDRENFPGGLPKYKTAHRLYHAGRALFEAVGVEAGAGRYEAGNNWFEKPYARLKELLK
jgi:hypothetical protein